MRKIRHIIAVVCAGVLLVACDDQRDLYVEAGPMLYVEGDWQPSLGVMMPKLAATSDTSNSRYRGRHLYLV